MTENAVAPRSTTDPRIETHREVRLALVMYGGVSLAIYMNGVSQELYHLVRATAPKRLVPEESEEPLVPTDQLSSTERVYRKLGQALELLIDTPTAAIKDIAESEPIRTRFVIDILSGSSAGGINAIFLAKALANNQSMEQLEALWMKEGDIAVLLNDTKSRVPGLTPERPPQSLLNSGRMYSILLDALDAEERSNPGQGTCDSPFVRELDLWITTTDLRGVVLPLKIANGIAFERRYRNVFHFVYGTEEASGGDRNDFTSDNNPILAFSARCTSAFPFAFRPMLFEDIAEPLSVTDGYRTIDLASSARSWSGFFKSYFPPVSEDVNPERQLPFLKRPFADGGALDNKPFTWATDTVLRRGADVPVDRKLIFIEPDPGHPELERTKQTRPDVLENFLLQGHSLPRQETIRQDIQTLIERNRTIDRVDRVLRGLAIDLLSIGEVDADTPDDGGPPQQSGDAWGRLGLSDEVEPRGQAYGGYHRLKVSAVTDDVSELIASVVGFDRDSDELLAIGYLVRSWRNQRYTYEPLTDSTGATRPTFNQFLVEFDLAYRLRRLMFLRRRINALDALNPSTVGVIATATPLTSEEILAWDADTRSAFRAELRLVKGMLSKILVQLRLLGRELCGRGNPHLAERLAQLDITEELLRSVIRPAEERGREDRAAEIVGERLPSFDEVGDELARLVRIGVPIPQRDRLPSTLESPYGTELAADRLEEALSGGGIATEVLRQYRQYFEDFDMVALPMLYGTDAGETDVIEIVRIAPEDATSIINERGSHFRVRKTRGWKYSHFGAFLSEEWRRNDILFGRLDAAECLINTFVPPSHPDRLVLLHEAQRAIILESLPLDRQISILGAEPDKLPDAELVKRFTHNYHVSEDLAPSVSLPILGRGVDIAGKMLDGVADEPGAMKKVTGWIARIGSVLAGIVALGIPGSGYGMVFRHIFPLLLAFEIVMAGLGLLFRSGTIARIGIAAVVLTLLTRVAVGVVTGFMQGKNRLVRAVLALVGLLAALAFIAVVAILLAGLGHGWTDLGTYWDDIKAFFDHVF